jgi:hypothetical protein
MDLIWVFMDWIGLILMVLFLFKGYLSLMGQWH